MGAPRSMLDDSQSGANSLSLRGFKSSLGRSKEITPFQEAPEGGGHLSLSLCFSLVRPYPDYPETAWAYPASLRQLGKELKSPYQRQSHTREKRVKGKLTVGGVYK